MGKRERGRKGEKISFTGETLSAQWADRCFALGERIATPVCGLVRNDILIGSVCTYLDAESVENYCHCEEQSDVAIRIPGIR